MKKTTIVYYLYLDRSKALKIRKQRYTTSDGELCVKLSVRVPNAFFKPVAIYKEVNVVIPQSSVVDVEVHADAEAKGDV